MSLEFIKRRWAGFPAPIFVTEDNAVFTDKRKAEQHANKFFPKLSITTIKPQSEKKPKPKKD